MLEQHKLRQVERYISAISRLYLGHISAISRLYLGYISAISRTRVLGGVRRRRRGRAQLERHARRRRRGAGALHGHLLINY